MDICQTQDPYENISWRQKLLSCAKLFTFHSEWENTVIYFNACTGLMLSYSSALSCCFISSMVLHITLAFVLLLPMYCISPLSLSLFRKMWSGNCLCFFLCKPTVQWINYQFPTLMSLRIIDQKCASGKYWSFYSFITTQRKRLQLHKLIIYKMLFYRNGQDIIIIPVHVSSNFV